MCNIIVHSGTIINGLEVVLCLAVAKLMHIHVQNLISIFFSFVIWPHGLYAYLHGQPHATMMGLILYMYLLSLVTHIEAASSIFVYYRMSYHNNIIVDIMHGRKHHC